MKVRFVSSLVFMFWTGAALAAGPAVTPDLIAKGKESYTTNCLLCHGEAGDGNGPAGSAMNPKPRNFVKDKFKKGDKPDAVFKVVSDGLKDTSMTGYAHLPVEERWAVTHYLLTFRAKK